jgi:pyruvate ferredoxin oxidoreductase gamma subunit
MIEIRAHGRGGQGAVTSSRVLALAAEKQGKFGQASQSMLGDRRGAPVSAFTRIDDKKIGLRGPILHPDYLIVLDHTLAQAVDLEADLKESGMIVINAHKDLGFKHKTTYVDATSIAIKNLGRPIVNTSMLGAFAAATNIVSLDSVLSAFLELFGEKFSPDQVQTNCKTIEETYHEVANA